MVNVHSFGTRRESVPIPPDDAVTTYFDGGSVRVGLEYRRVTDAVLRDHYGADTASADLLDAATAEAGGATLDDEGFSLHVFAGDGERLRFDDFGDNPHYHYIVPGSHHVVVAHDDVAHGPLLPWALGALRTRAAEMLRHAGAGTAADGLDAGQLGRALDDAEAAWKDATRR